jgi:2',3'-cyclic-nucleotide 2'-phosphodiesterase (5'-nucleotidase family)
MRLKLLHTNDWHGKLDDQAEARVAAARGESDLYFDTGDAIKAGNLGVPMRQEEVWARLARLQCTASVIGNRETHILESAFRAKLAGAAHPVLCANLHRRDGTPYLPGELQLEVQGFHIGVFGVSVPMVTEKMRTQRASAFLWDQPLPVAAEIAKRLRPQVDLLIALTHIGHRADRALAEMGLVDVILGGHSHTVLPMPELVGSTWIAQGGSHGRFMGRYEWANGALSGGLVSLSC